MAHQPWEGAVPIWVQTPSGIYVPSHVPDLRPPNLRDMALSGLPASRLRFLPGRPSSLDDFRIYPAEADLGLRAMPVDEVAEVLADVPFEPAMLAISRIAAAHWHIWTDGPAQVELARSFLGGIPGMARIASFVEQGPSHLVFSEQHLFVLQRLLVEYARDGELEASMSGEQADRLWRCLLAMTTVIEQADHQLAMEAQSSAEAWLAYTTKNGIYFSRPAPPNAMSRAFALATMYARQSTHHDKCPLDQWAVEDHAGLSTEEQIAAGFALYQSSGALDPDSPTVSRSLVDVSTFSTTALAGREESMREVLSADRNWYREAFEASTGSIMVWDRQPFLQRPFLRASNGRLILLSPRTISEWLGDGLYYRGLDSALLRNAQGRYSPWMGGLVEEYAVDLIRDAYPEPRIAGSGHAHGEMPYGDNLTPDALIDFGTDLVAIEVCSGRLTRAALVEGDLHALSRDLDLKVFGKIRQLGERITDILNGDVPIPGASEALQRIWPVVVTTSLIHTELLAEAIESQLPDVLRTDGRVQPMTLLDLEGLELLMGMVEAGASILHVLTSKTSGPFQHLDLIRWVLEDPASPGAAVPRRVDDGFRTEGEALLAALGASEPGA